MTVEQLTKESVWQEKSKYDEAERVYYENLNKKPASCGPVTSSKSSPFSKSCNQSIPFKSNKPLLNPAPKKFISSEDKAGKKSFKEILKEKDASKPDQVSSISSHSQSKSLVEEIVKAREHIKVSLENVNGIQGLPSNSISSDVSQVVNKLQNDYKNLKSDVDNVTSLLQRIEIRVKNLENALTGKSAEKSTSAKTPAKKDNDDDDDVDLFGSGSEDDDEEAKKVKEQRLAEYAAKKSKKPALIAKSMIIFDVKPWDDETDMKAMEAEVRKVTMDGLLWGSAKLVPLAYGIQKLQIASVVEDEKVSVDDITDRIQEIEELVQSVDIAAFNKL